MSIEPESQPSAADVGWSEGVNASVVCDALQATQGLREVRHRMVCELMRLTGEDCVSGPAYTVRVSNPERRDGKERERWFAALEGCPPGAILMIQVIGDVGGAAIGDVVAHRLKMLGVRGAIVDGAARDVQGMADHDLSVWARELTIQGMLPSNALTEVGVDIVCGGCLVRQGDIVVADADGIVVVPKTELARTVTAANAFLESEVETHRRVAAGERLIDVYPEKSGKQGA
jgi:4-hydroxy-4-methyl-2-oxoglutarate aldolase